MTLRLRKKSYEFRYWQERSGPKKAPARRRTARDWGADTSRPGVSASNRRAGGRHSAARNFSLRSARNAEFALEDSLSAKPSRKSTRASLNQMKPSHPLRQAKLARLYLKEIPAVRKRR